jgi:hypothetical protein
MYTLNLSAGQLEVITSLLEAEVSSILDEIRYAPETMHQYQDELIELVDLQDQIDYVFDAEDESYSDVCEDCSVSYSDDKDYQFKEHNLQQESNQFNAEKIDAMLRSFGFKIIR